MRDYFEDRAVTNSLKSNAQRAVEFIRFALGDDVHIGHGINAGYTIMVSPTTQDCTFAWDTEGATGWSEHRMDTDIFEVLRDTYFSWVDWYHPDQRDEADEDFVMPLGDAITKSMGALVEWLEWSADSAIQQVTT